MYDRSRRKISAEELVVVPWKNGGGLTTEIAVGAPVSSDHEWPWRISAADVREDGPFSDFSGIDRSIAVTDGAGMDLRFEDGTILPLEINQPVEFDGSASVEGRLRDGPIRDFNVMVDRRYFEATLRIALGAKDIPASLADGSVYLVHLLEGVGRVSGPGHDAENIGPQETTIYDGPADVTLSLEPGSRAAIVTLNRLQQG